MNTILTLMLQVDVVLPWVAPLKWLVLRIGWRRYHFLRIC
jgi:hypothetical protein